MCDVCGRSVCPSACPGAKYPEVFECVVCGEEAFPWETEEEFENRRCICGDCAEYGDEEVIEEAREAEYDRMNRRAVLQ